MDAPSTLPTEPAERKTYPIATGVLDYFPDAIAAIAHVSYVGNEQHNPGEPLHWAREKSTDQEDTMLRHFLERGTLDKDGLRHSAKMVWRALAILQLEIEAARARKLPAPHVPGMTSRYYGIDPERLIDHVRTESWNARDRTFGCSCGGLWVLDLGDYWHRPPQVPAFQNCPRPGGAF